MISPACNESVSRHFGSFRKALLEIAQTNDLMLNSKDIRETTLWQAPRERHLAAFELWLAAAGSVVACARLDSLVSLAGRLTGARTRSAAKPLAVTVRPGCRHEVVQAQLFDAFGCDVFSRLLLSPLGYSSTVVTSTR